MDDEDLDSVIDTSDEVVGGEQGENIPQAMQTQIAQARALFNQMANGPRAAQVTQRFISAAENGNTSITGASTTGPFISGGGVLANVQTGSVLSGSQILNFVPSSAAASLAISIPIALGSSNGNASAQQTVFNTLANSSVDGVLYVLPEKNLGYFGFITQNPSLSFNQLQGSTLICVFNSGGGGSTMAQASFTPMICLNDMNSNPIGFFPANAPSWTSLQPDAPIGAPQCASTALNTIRLNHWLAFSSVDTIYNNLNTLYASGSGPCANANNSSACFNQIKCDIDNGGELGSYDFQLIGATSIDYGATNTESVRLYKFKLQN